MKEMRKNHIVGEEKKEENLEVKLEFVEKNGEKRCIYSCGDKKIEITDEDMIKRMKAIEEEVERDFEARVSAVIKGIENS